MSRDSRDADPIRFERIPVERIHVYERNPRRAPNPEYDRIKQSIRERGLEQPLIVADRADGVGYVVSAGGNTRLAILKELSVETGDARYSAVDCVVRPWESDAAALLAHLRENDLRGALSFIDRAGAVVELHRLLAGDAKLSQRQLAARLSADGYAVSQALISPMFYAVEVLEPLLPVAFAAGLGRRPVERIRALERAAGAVWQAHRVGSKASFAETFAILCRRSDAPDWSFEAFRGAVELEIASAADARIQSVRLAIDQALAGSTGERSGDAVPTDPGASGRLPAAQVNGTAEPAPPMAWDPAELERAESEPVARSQAPVSDPEQLSEISALRAQAWALAHRLAERYGLGQLVVETPGVGTGLTVVDVPDEGLLADLDPETLGRVTLLWWHIVACAELMVAPPDLALGRLGADSILRIVLETRDAEMLFERVWTTDPGQVGDLLWRTLPDADWQDFVDLMKTYRRLHAVAASLDQPLWNTDIE